MDVMIGSTSVAVANMDTLASYAPLSGAVFTTTPQVNVCGTYKTMALYSDIPSLTPYALLASPTFQCSYRYG